jgi:hypothetical protein
VRARHKLQYSELQRRYAEWEITGAPEIQHVTGDKCGAVHAIQATAARPHRADAVLDAPMPGTNSTGRRSLGKTSSEYE